MGASEAQQMGRPKREEMLPLLKRHEIQVLRRAGHSRAEVARLADDPATNGPVSRAGIERVPTVQVAPAGRWSSIGGAMAPAS